MNILITGVAGFIGFNLAESLSKSHKVFGIDSYDNYYSIKLKRKRINELKKNKKFFFEKIDVNNVNTLHHFLKNKKIQIIYHLAAQAGVRYSYQNPAKYVNNNILGFYNIIQIAKKIGVQKIIYASSSSVYGDSKKFPLKEKQKLYPKNIYAVSKMLNEQTAELYSKITNINFIGLRFFTVYGEWGRPDMFLFKLFKCSVKKTVFELNNSGNHKRDFTYIEDVVKIMKKVINIKKYRHLIFNVCSNTPVSIQDIIEKFSKKEYLKFKNIKKHKADILITHGCNSKIRKMSNFLEFSPFYEKLWKTYNWYVKNKIYKL
jgi:UDP-glucuronate 4-epimerase